MVEWLLRQAHGKVLVNALFPRGDAAKRKFAEKRREDAAKEKKAKKLKRLPKIQKGMRASGIWERKISPAGVQYMKMADEVSKRVT